MKATELASLSAAGVRVVANWEWSANPPERSGHRQGSRDAGQGASGFAACTGLGTGLLLDRYRATGRLPATHTPRAGATYTRPNSSGSIRAARCSANSRRTATSNTRGSRCPSPSPATAIRTERGTTRGADVIQTGNGYVARSFARLGHGRRGGLRRLLDGRGRPYGTHIRRTPT